MCWVGLRSWTFYKPFKFFHSKLDSRVFMDLALFTNLKYAPNFQLGNFFFFNWIYIFIHMHIVVPFYCSSNLQNVDGSVRDAIVNLLVCLSDNHTFLHVSTLSCVGCLLWRMMSIALLSLTESKSSVFMEARYVYGSLRSPDCWGRSGVQ